MHPALTEAVPPVSAFPVEGSDVANLMRSHDWSSSALGASETWPASLHTVVSQMLASKFPMFAAWGPELAFLYSDG